MNQSGQGVGRGKVKGGREFTKGPEARRPHLSRGQPGKYNDRVSWVRVAMRSPKAAWNILHLKGAQAAH